MSNVSQEKEGRLWECKVRDAGGLDFRVLYPTDVHMLYV